MRIVKVNGMTCQHCVMAVEKALNEIDGIEKVRVDLSKGEATFEEKRPIDTEELRKAIEKAGYKMG